MLVAKPTVGSASTALAEEDDLQLLQDLVVQFAERFASIRSEWTERLARYRSAGKRTVIWGSGSKGVAFLNTVGTDAGVEYVVDINTFRQGHFMAGTGQQIVGPQFLVDYKPDVVVVMNPIYRDEIERDLAELGLQPEVLTT